MCSKKIIEKHRNRGFAIYFSVAYIMPWATISRVHYLRDKSILKFSFFQLLKLYRIRKDWSLQNNQLRNRYKFHKNLLFTLVSRTVKIQSTKRQLLHFIVNGAFSTLNFIIKLYQPWETWIFLNKSLNYQE